MILTYRWVVLTILAIALLGLRPSSRCRADEGLAFFEAKIRPVLVQHCYSCHNSNELSEGSLVLDTRDGVLKGGEGGKIVEPGNIAASRLLAILRHEITGLEMPEDGEKLSPAIIADFEKWISLGAPDPRDAPPSPEELTELRSWAGVLNARKNEAWAFQPIRAPKIPEVNDPRWAKNPIDRYAFSKMQENGLRPGVRAANGTLVRRLYFALIGLPPTPEELEKWTRELESVGGYDRLVDHLLNRPQFGERWARHWMDWVRYADSYGSEGDPGIENGWYYRDYLIRALNADISYPQLVREHIAGDLLAEPRVNEELGFNESLIGTAHWRMVFHGFSPTDALDEKVRFVDDQINTFSKAFLGITLSCARCHNHKFDPISQEDYYAMFGIFASCRPSRHAINIDDQTSTREMLVELKNRIRTEISDDWLAQVDARQTADTASIESWLEVKDPGDVRSPVANLFRRVRGGEEFSVAWNDELRKHLQHRAAVESYRSQEMLQNWRFTDGDSIKDWYRVGKGLEATSIRPGDFSVAAEGDNILSDVFPAGVYTNLVSDKDPARFASGDFKIPGKYQLWLRVQGDGNSQVRYVVEDYPRNGVVFPTAGIGRKWHWQKFDLTYWEGDEIHIELANGRDAPVLVNAANRSWFGIREAFVLPADQPGPPEPLDQLNGYYRVLEATKPSSIEEALNGYWKGLRDSIMRWRNGDCDDADALWIAGAVESNLLSNRSSANERLNQLVQQYRELEQALPVPTRVPGLDETGPRDNELYLRGNHKQLGEIVPRRFLEAIDADPYTKTNSGRLELAEDVLREDNPLAYRVIVNRVWHHLFGRGIVLTTDNFGKLGSLPSDPELLDYLAVHFREKNGSIKEIIRHLVTSEVWQLSTRPTSESLEKDPENEFLSHANLRRLEAEAIRDSLLAMSGILSSDMYGQPIDGGVPRRSVYMRVQRNALDPFLRAFDFPEPFSCTGRRDVTNVPAQSLAFMNDPGVTEWAKLWSRSLLRVQKFADDQARLTYMFQAVTGRLPKANEVAQLAMFLEEAAEEQQSTIAEIAKTESEADKLRNSLASLLDPARQRLVEKLLGESRQVDSNSALQPVSRWEFDGNLEDSLGGAHMSLHDGAKLAADHVVVGASGYLLSEPLKRELEAKTLEAWVQLDRMDQQGGGVITIQSRDGVFFDAIVYGEQSQGQWLAGSNGFERTRSFAGGVETEADQQVVHLAISYHPDGRIVGFRNGKLYGTEYQSNGPRTYGAGESIIGLGIRHLPAGGNRLLSGKIFRAQLYDRALTAEEVEASYHGFPVAVTTAAVIATLSDTERAQITSWQSELNQVQSDLRRFEGMPREYRPENAWAEVARALFSLKEFIFIQ